MIKSEIKSEQELIGYVAHGHFTAVVVDGFDGVGKGRVLDILSETFEVEPYRPNYNMWQSHDVKQPERWKMSGFFWDIYSHFFDGRLPNATPMLFDRGVISGAVYNNDYSIAKDYKYMIRNQKILHVLVTCSAEDYQKFANVRGVSEYPSYTKYQEYTERYLECFELAGVDYVVYENHFNDSLATSLSAICEGCGHYSYGWCRHPLKDCKVNPYDYRCLYSKDKEVQDDPKMHVM